MIKHTMKQKLNSCDHKKDLAESGIPMCVSFLILGAKLFHFIDYKREKSCKWNQTKTFLFFCILFFGFIFVVNFLINGYVTCLHDHCFYMKNGYVI